jgi:hypothetical protein
MSGLARTLDAVDTSVTAESHTLPHRITCSAHVLTPHRGTGEPATPHVLTPAASARVSALIVERDGADLAHPFLLRKRDVLIARVRRWMGCPSAGLCRSTDASETIGRLPVDGAKRRNRPSFGFEPDRPFFE